MKLFLRRLVSRPWLQTVWRQGLKLSMAGLNIGGGYGFDSSGEINVLHRLQRLCAMQDTAVIVDVGAHRGEYAAAVLRVIGNKAVIHCCEPDPVAFAALDTRFAARPAVHCHQTALGESDGTGWLITDHPGSTTGSVETGGRSPVGERQISARIRRLEEFCGENRIARIDLLKLDVEGYEYDVLKGAGRMLSGGRISLIQFEFGETYIRYRRYLRDIFDLLSAEYRIYRVLQNGFAEVKSYSPEEEIFKITNFMAVCRRADNTAPQSPTSANVF